MALTDENGGMSTTMVDLMPEVVDQTQEETAVEGIPVTAIQCMEI